MSKPLIILLEDRKRAIADAAIKNPPGLHDKFERLAGEYAGINYVIELIKSLEKDKD